MTRTLLTNATILDGSGSPPRHAHLLLEDDRIAAITDTAPPDAAAVDCAGLHLAPGFIDIHSHADSEVLRRLPNKILQGVTTEVVGNCGFSLFPTHPHTPKMTGELFDGEPEEGMPSAAEYFEALDAAGPRVNVAALTGHSALRVYAMQMRPGQPTEDEFRTLETALEKSLEAGSIGFSTGLNCGPAQFSDTAELVRLCAPVRRHGAYYTTHMRDYKFRVLDAVNEALEIGRRAQVPVQISHMQVVGQKNWHRLEPALEAIEQARASGIDVAMDAYPYLAGSCSLLQFLPDWTQAGGTSALLTLLEDSAQRERVIRETDDYMSNTWDDIVVCDVAAGGNRSLLGKTIARIAADRDRPAPDTAIDIIREERGQIFIISFNNNEANLRKVLSHPLTSIITDGFVVEGGMSHPRTFGTYPKFLGECVRDKQWMPLEQAIVKTSALAARRFRLERRGVLEPGAFADIVAFDAAAIGTDSDYATPDRTPRGIHHVIVNGAFAVRNGHLTDAASGRALRHA
ncbi:MAG: D-aminoacylase [Bryobacteraceae bacterium]